MINQRGYEMTEFPGGKAGKLVKMKTALQNNPGPAIDRAGGRWGNSKKQIVHLDMELKKYLAPEFQKKLSEKVEESYQLTA